MTELNWLSIAFIIAAFNGIFLSVLLWKKTNRQHPANRWLVLLLICMVISLLLRLTYSEDNAIFLQFPHLTVAGDFVMFLIGPALYFYVKQLLSKGFKLAWNHWPHLLPLIIFLLSFFYLLTFSREELLHLHVNGKIYPYYISILSAAIGLIGGYAIAGLNLLNQYKAAYFQAYSADPKVAYLHKILFAVLGVILCWIPAHFHSILPGFDILVSNFFYQVSFLLMSGLVMIVAYYAIQIPEIFSLPLAAEKTKYQHSKLKEQDALAIKNKLLSLFENEQPYLDPALSLSKLADLLRVNHVHLSQVINEQCGKTFYDLVNDYRVEVFIKKAQSKQYQKFTLLAIALESGFRTKTSFNKAFKKIKGTTPSQFLKNNPPSPHLST